MKVLRAVDISDLLIFSGLILFFIALYILGGLPVVLLVFGLLLIITGAFAANKAK